MSPERPEQDDDFLEDEEQDEHEGQRSIFATGWFRAVLVLLVLAVIAVIAVPLIGGWFEPTPPPKVATPAPTPRPSEPAPSRGATRSSSSPACNAKSPPGRATAARAASAPPASRPARAWRSSTSTTPAASNGS